MPDDPAPLRARLGDRMQDVWLEEDVLTFLVRSDQGPITLIGGIEGALAQVGGSDLWMARIRLPAPEVTFISYALLGTAPAGPIAFDLWRGASAPTPPSPSPAEDARSETFVVPSRHLGEDRSVTVILPPGAQPARPLPAIVLADGQGAESLGAIVAQLVRTGAMRPVAIVGIHNGGYRGDRSQPFDPSLDMRAREYLERGDPERFTRHLDWVIDEVLPEVERRFGISRRREDLALAGFSNGGAFAAAAGHRRPDAFGAVIALSIGIAPATDGSAAERSAPPPRCFLAAGRLEPAFLKGTTATRDLFAARGAAVHLEEFEAGHDPAMWNLAFARFLPEVFPPE